jgi:arylsulfatase A
MSWNKPLRFLLLFVLAYGPARTLADMLADSPVKFPKEGALPAKYPPDRVATTNEATESDYYIFASPERSVVQIQAIQAEMPDGRFTPPPPDWAHLSRAARILRDGGELHILAMGDSIVNDTMRSGWVAELREAYPQCRITATVYVRGGGGCQHYREQERVARSVIPRKPDLVFIGGISQRDMDSIREVIRQLRTGLPEVEILLATGTFGTADPREPEALAKAPHSGTGAYGAALKKLASEERCAYLDMTTPWAEYIRSTKLHPHLFYRDVVHANEQGEQILSKILMSFFSATAIPKVGSKVSPSIIFVLADDLGYGDIGPFGQKIIRTPTLDRLAAEGVRFTQHYAGNNVCAPSRCVLMTGKHPGHAFIRDNREVGDWDSLKGQYPIPASEFTLPEALKKAGYVTGAFGKWGLGGVGTSGDPLKHGFERFFGYNDQRHAHNYFPQVLVDDSRLVNLDNPLIKIPSTLSEEADSKDPANYAQFLGKQYAPDLLAEQALNFIRENKDRPFFLYYPTTVPHLALQVPNDSLVEYCGKISDQPYRGGKGYLPHHDPHAAYAAMITRLDREIGRMVQLVKDLGLEDNTIFVFTSDNGAVYPYGGTDPEFFRSNGDLRGYKGGMYEGGLRVPLIVRWKDHVPAKTTSAFVTGFEDWLPTLLELIGATNLLPGGLDGLSFAPTLLGRSQPQRPFLYRESPGYGGQQSVRVGDWKAVRQKLHPGARQQAPAAVTTELYDLATDPAETTNVAERHPDVVAQLEKLMREQHTPSSLFPIRALDGNHPDKVTE